MEIMEKDLPYEVSEIKECGLTEVKANIIKPPRIGEAYGWFECRMIKHVNLYDKAIWVIGEILDAEAKEEAFDGVVDVEKVKPLNHIWGKAFVTEMKRTSFKRA
jgi:flavin reductase (DIM6/NTAB) family NADH-FMN oxidoreductase RutF